MEDPIDFGNSNPFGFGCCCDSGRYESSSDVSFAEEFLQNGAGLYIGSTEVSPRKKNNAAGKWFFSHWVNSPYSVAHVLRGVKRNIGGMFGKVWRSEYHLFGDAKFDVLPGTKTHAAPTAQASEVITTLQVSLPAYEATYLDGEDHVSLPGGDLLVEEYGRPIVPYATVSVNYPAGTEVQSVSLIERSGLSATTGLRLPTASEEWGGAASARAAGQESVGWWPPRDFDWYVERDPLGATVLQLQIYPFYYNPQTTDVKFYQDYSFNIEVTTSTVDIHVLATDAKVYAPGDAVAVDLWLRNSGNPQDVIVDAVVVDRSSGDPVDGLMLEALNALAGLASFHTAWDSGGVDPGRYGIDVEIREGSGKVLDGATVDFELGIHAGEITSLTAAPELFDIGDTIAISTCFKNTGTVPMTGTAIVEVQALSGFTTTASFTHTVAGLAPLTTVVLDDDWDTSGVDEGSYRVVGHVKYHSTSTDPVAVTVGTLAHVYLPLVLRGSP
jgi:hypothetical protein